MNITWMVIAGRKVAHAFRPSTDLKFYATCGQCALHTLPDLAEASVRTRRCEMCEIVLATGINVMISKFFMDHVPASERAARRRKWRTFKALCEQDPTLASKVLALEGLQKLWILPRCLT